VSSMMSSAKAQGWR